MRREALAGLELRQLGFVASRSIQDARVVLLHVRRLELPPIPDTSSSSSSRATANLTSTMMMVMVMIQHST